MRRLLSILMLFSILVAICTPSFAFDMQEHDKCLESVLFGMDGVPAESKESVKMLEYASYLALDQCNGNGEDKLTYLKNCGVPKLPVSINQIDFRGNSFHRRFTHRGWNYLYSGDSAKANWPVRKVILCSTTDKVFDFGVSEELKGGFCNQCDSFSALVYYTHILGDILSDKSPKGFTEQIPFARAHADENTPDLFYELRPHLEILFHETGETRSRVYQGLMNKFDKLARQARGLEATTGGVNTQEKIMEQKEYEQELMDTLKAYVPRLLRRTDFFEKAFYRDA